MATLALPTVTLDTTPKIVITSVIPQVTDQASLMVDFTVDGRPDSETFNLKEGANVLTITTPRNASGKDNSQSFWVTRESAPATTPPASTVFSLTTQNQDTFEYIGKDRKSVV